MRGQQTLLGLTFIVLALGPFLLRPDARATEPSPLGASVRCELSIPRDGSGSNQGGSFQLKQLRLPLAAPQTLLFSLRSRGHQYRPQVHLIPRNGTVTQGAAPQNPSANSDRNGTAEVLTPTSRSTAETLVIQIAPDNAGTQLRPQAPTGTLSTQAKQLRLDFTLSQLNQSPVSLRLECALSARIQHSVLEGEQGPNSSLHEGPQAVSISRVNRSPAVVPNPPLRLPDGVEPAPAPPLSTAPTSNHLSNAGSASGAK